jgi:TPR repeat protein
MIGMVKGRSRGKLVRERRRAVVEARMKRWAVAVGVWVLLVSPLAGALGDPVPVPENYDQAMRWYERAAEGGNAKAQFYLGVLLESGARGAADPAAAAAGWFRKAAEQGHTEAQYRLGLVVFQGRGVKRDRNEAAQWFEAAATGGLADAQYNLGLIYETGAGVVRDAGRAAGWYEKAADQGIGGAQLQLSLLYARGKGVPRDPVRALMWLEVVLAGRLENRADYRNSLTAAMTPAQIEEARQMARRRLEGTRRAP